MKITDLFEYASRTRHGAYLLNKPVTPQRTAPMTMTKATLRAIYDQIENDPLAGNGCISKIDLFIDRVLAHWNTVERPKESGVAPRPLLSQPSVARSVKGPAPDLSQLPQNAEKKAS